MKRSNRPWLFLAVSTATLAVSSVLVGMTNHPPSKDALSPVPVKGFSAKELMAKDVLRDELERRFTDRQNVDFGMARVVRKGTRLHFGPTMEKHGEYRSQQTRRADDQSYEFEYEGQWYKTDDRKPLMTPENENETGAIKLLRDSNVDVAIYTVGQFELDKGEKPGPGPAPSTGSNKHYHDFAYGRDTSIRAKGPAYIQQLTSTAPRAYEIIDFGRLAWASNQKDYFAQGKDGWMYFAHRVNSNDASCGKCHGDRKTYQDGKYVDIKGAIQKPGDPVGLFVIAMRRADGK